MPTLLGLDLGTSSFKASAYRDTGEHLGTVTRPAPWRPTPSGQELDPDEFEDLVRTVVEVCAGTHADGPIAGLGVTGMAETAFVETEDGVRHRARAWNGARAARELPDATLWAVTGLLDAARTTAVELRRVTEAGGRVREWAGVPEQAVRVLGGDVLAERSLASRTGLVDVRTGDWSRPLVAWAGVAHLDLPAIRPAGTPAGAVPEGAAAGAVLTVAGHDHVAGAVGAGIVDGGAVFDSLGTGEGIVARVADHPTRLTAERLAELTSAGFNVGLGVGVDDVVVLAGLGSGNRLNLLVDALDTRGFARVDLLRPDGRPSGIPETTGLPAELSELIDALGGAGWQELRATAVDVVRRTVSDLPTAQRAWWAAVARVTRNARDALDAVHRLVPAAGRLVAAGGWLGDPGIRALRERMLGPFEVPDVAQVGTRGAALLAGLAAGMHPTRAEPPSLIGEGATA